MGGRQSLEESDDIASPRSPNSPRVLPVDGDEMPLPELLDTEASQTDEALTPKSSGTVTLHNDDDGTASPLDDEPGRAASQRSLLRRLSSSRRRDEKKADANESRATARTLVLKGHSGRNVTCLAALDGGRLASGSYDDSVVVIWNLADGTQLAKLEGHKYGVSCLAALDGARLASGSYDHSIIIWNLADGTQLAKLEGHKYGVSCLAALDGDRLASGECYKDKPSYDHSIIIWNLADGSQLATLEGYTGDVYCLAALEGRRLASGGDDNSVIIWNLADNTQLAKLEHTEPVSQTAALFRSPFYDEAPNCVKCLAALDGGRLASGSDDKSIIIWNLADGAQIAKLVGHTKPISSLAALDGGRLASCSFDNTIHIWNVALDAAGGETPVVMWWQKGGINCLVALDGGRLATGDDEVMIRARSVLRSSTGQLGDYNSAFEFEEVARDCRENDALADDLLDAVDRHIRVNSESAESASKAITLQAHVFDAIAKVVNEQKDEARQKSIDSLAPRVLNLVSDDDLLPDMMRRGVSNAAIQELAPSPLFRVVLDAKFAAGPVFVLYFELFLFVVLGFCFLRIAAFEVLDVSKWFAAEKTVEIVAAFVILAYFSAREIYQMWSTRATELATPEDPFGPAWNRKVDGLAYYALLIPRLSVGFVACLSFLPVFLVVIGLKCAGKDEWMDAFLGDNLEDEDAWFGKRIGTPILHDPLTFFGLARAWRYDYWNIIDAATIGCALASFARAAMPGRQLSADLAVATSILMWIRFCWYLKNMRLGWAKFVLMIEQIAWDLREYLLFFLVVLLMFASAFYLYIGPRKSAEFGFHDDGAPNAYRNFGYTVYNLILLGFVGDFDADNFDKVVLRVLLVFYIIVVIVIFLNVLIAIVSDSYDLSMAKAEGLYYRSRLELITETAPIASRLPKWMLPDYEAKDYDNSRDGLIENARLNKMLTDALDDLKKDKADDPNRLNYTINAVEAIVDNRTRKLEAELAATREKIDTLTKMLQTLIDKQP